VQLGDTEIWTWVNHSNMAHPMTIHGGSFYVLDRNGVPPPAWERGPKSVVNVDVGDSVRTIMRFAEYTTGDWPLMYHCHNLMHINRMMWQFIIVDPTTTIGGHQSTGTAIAYPVPAGNIVRIQANFPVQHIRILDLQGREMLRMPGPHGPTAVVDISALAPGTYIARLEGLQSKAVVKLVRE
jgi:hypothetical protein